jgi:hypothetical protein
MQMEEFIVTELKRKHFFSCGPFKNCVFILWIVVFWAVKACNLIGGY